MKLTQNIKYILKSSLVLILASSIIYAAGTLTSLHSGDPITEDNWNTMVQKITDLENQVSNLSSGNGLVSEVSGSPFTPSGVGTWTISGLTIGKPLIIGFKGLSSEAGLRLKVLSGSEIGKNDNAFGWLLNNGSNSNNSTSTWVLVPTEETVKINIIEGHENIILHAYQ